MIAAGTIERGRVAASLSHEDLTAQDITDLKALAADQALPYEVSLYEMSDGKICAGLLRSDRPLSGPKFGFSRHGEHVLVVGCGTGATSGNGVMYGTMAMAIVAVANALFHFLCSLVGIPDPESTLVTDH